VQTSSKKQSCRQQRAISKLLQLNLPECICELSKSSSCISPVTRDGLQGGAVEGRSLQVHFKTCLLFFSSEVIWEWQTSSSLHFKFFYLRLSRRRSSVNPVSSKPSSQRHHSKEQPQNPGSQGEEVSAPDSAVRPQAAVKTALPALTGKWLAEAQVPVAKAGCQGCPAGADGSGAAQKAVTGQQLPEGDAATELHDVSSVAAIPARQAAQEEAPESRASTSTPKAARDGDPAAVRAGPSLQGLEKLLFQDSDSKVTTGRSKTRRCSGRRSLVGGPHKSRRASLAEKYSLARKRESMIRRSISRAISKKAAARGSSSASSRVSCKFLSVVECFYLAKSASRLSWGE